MCESVTEDRLAEYIIVATIESFTGSGINVKGVSPYLFQDSKKKQWNLFELCTCENSTTPNSPIIVEFEDKNSIRYDGSLMQVIALAFIEKKALKMTISFKGKNPVSLVSISRNEN